MISPVAQPNTPSTISHTWSAPGWPLALAPALYTLALALVSDLRAEIAALALLTGALWIASPATRRLAVELLPAILTIVAFDALRYLRPLFVTPGRVLGCELRAVELTLFRAGPDTTLPDWFARHHAPLADLFFAIPYAGFIYIAAIYGAILFFRDRPTMRLLIWSFAGMYLLAFAIWIVFPAAPPWYLRAHGCVIDINAASNAAALLRVDQALGINYFAEFYARAPNPFGAMPSLHNGYAMLGLLVVWPIAGWKERAAAILYVAWMMMASLYLDHHWVIDGLAGWLCAALAVALSRSILRRSGKLPTVAPSRDKA